jgi:hypothetical protein
MAARVGLLKKLPYGNHTSVTAAGCAATSFEVSARAKRNPHFFPYCPATLLMGPQEDGRDCSLRSQLVGPPRVPAGRNRAIHSRVPWPQVALPLWPIARRHPKKAIYSLTGNASSPFHAEPTQYCMG